MPLRSIVLIGPLPSGPSGAATSTASHGAWSLASYGGTPGATPTTVSSSSSSKPRRLPSVLTAATPSRAALAQSPSPPQTVPVISTGNSRLGSDGVHSPWTSTETCRGFVENENENENGLLEYLFFYNRKGLAQRVCVGYSLYIFFIQMIFSFLIAHSFFFFFLDQIYIFFYQILIAHSICLGSSRSY